MPELIRTSPLTLREWQVLGLIYSGYSNNQIAGELDVAANTIKTHIRICIRSWAWFIVRKRYSGAAAAAFDGDGGELTG